MIHTGSVVIGILILLAIVYAYKRSNDPLHPTIITGPFFLYAYAIKPSLLYPVGYIERLLDERQLLLVQAVNVFSVVAFCWGAVWHCRYRSHSVASRISPNQGTLKRTQNLFGEMRPLVRQRIFRTAFVLGFIGFGSWLFLLNSSGGLLAIYSQAKGDLSSSVGWLSEAWMLLLPAIALLFVCWSVDGMNPARWAAVLFLAMPHMIHGILGARRGPTFFIFATLIFGAYTTARKKPKLITVVAAMVSLGVLMLFLISNRDRLYIGTDWTSDEPRTSTSIATVRDAEDVGEDWIFSAGVIAASFDTGTHFWGRRYFVQNIVKPIPKALWPNKYEDTGFGWMEGQRDMQGITDSQWLASVGWIPVRGAACGLTADAFQEFWFFGIPFCFLCGLFYSTLWYRMTTQRGVWTILFVIAAAFSVYIPTQDVNAWFYRFLLVGVPIMLAWRFYIDPHSTRIRRPSGSAASRRVLS